jgi:hypothetical protein
VCALAPVYTLDGSGQRWVSVMRLDAALGTLYVAVGRQEPCLNPASPGNKHQQLNACPQVAPSQFLVVRGVAGL